MEQEKRHKDLYKFDLNNGLTYLKLGLLGYMEQVYTPGKTIAVGNIPYSIFQECANTLKWKHFKEEVSSTADKEFIIVNYFKQGNLIIISTYTARTSTLTLKTE